jgi:hypothetical protein
MASISLHDLRLVSHVLRFEVDVVSAPGAVSNQLEVRFENA